MHGGARGGALSPVTSRPTPSRKSRGYGTSQTHYRCSYIRIIPDSVLRRLRFEASMRIDHGNSLGIPTRSKRRGLVEHWSADEARKRLVYEG